MTHGSGGPAGNTVFSYYRRISLAMLLDAFKEGDRLLELGGGTGEEAATLAQRGIRVLLTDVSPSQVESAKKRARGQGLEHMLDARVVPIERIGELQEEFGAGSFDGAFSSFGALNCVPDIEMLPSRLHHLVKPGGRFVCSVMNSPCGWEVLSGLATLRPYLAFRRIGACTAGIDGVRDARFTVRYFTIAGLVDIFGRYFDIERAEDHPLLPPPYLDGVFRHLDGYLAWASRRGDGALRGLGDHTFITMKRRNIV